MVARALAFGRESTGASQGVSTGSRGRFNKSSGGVSQNSTYDSQSREHIIGNDGYSYGVELGQVEKAEGRRGPNGQIMVTRSFAQDVNSRE